MIPVRLSRARSAARKTFDASGRERICAANGVDVASLIARLIVVIVTIPFLDDDASEATRTI